VLDHVLQRLLGDPVERRLDMGGQPAVVEVDLDLGRSSEGRRQARERGAETEIGSSTKNVLIECAWFHPVAVRRAAKFLKLHTEASTRFGRGADPELAEKLETAKRVMERYSETLQRLADS
jgi:hypothetical protein